MQLNSRLVGVHCDYRIPGGLYQKTIDNRYQFLLLISNAYKYNLSYLANLNSVAWHTSELNLIAEILLKPHFFSLKSIA